MESNWRQNVADKGLSNWEGTGPYAGRTIHLCARDLLNASVYYTDLAPKSDLLVVWFGFLDDNQPYSYIVRTTLRPAGHHNFPYGFAVLPDHP